ncbi:Serine/threonine protein kinase [Nonomuraea solani]|uniref:Serine/threonine protein kinase n=1 Tax=Nonomuraea solani TaxID=1144553 RepID=A0A1H5W7A2_9ACTN|nr:serine/threonine-protein kinase [Nonomuraea solani]SEF94707.1 Serine/threonine protein kinase [Nonomuraea solani]
MSTQTQEHLGPYRKIREIGSGGMGVVHLGLDGAGRQVAIKVLHPHVAADLKARDRLSREVETMRRVRSRYVAEVIDAELSGGRPYVVTRFVAGRTLEDTVMAEGPLAARDVIGLAQGLCQALVDIHAAGVIHRDLKPSNVMLVGGEPLVIDFGIAHLVNASRLTQTGMVVGTPGYLAPEIIRAGQITQAADVHALASTVFFAATGLAPFGTGSFESVCFNTMEGRARIDEAPVWLRAWLSRALSVDPEARPRAGELLRLARALQPAGGPGGAPHTASGPGAAPPWAGHPVDRAGEGRPSERTLTMDAVSDLLPPVAYARREEHPAEPAPAPTELSGRPRPRRPAPPPAEPFEWRRFVKGSGFVGVLALVTLVALTVMNPVVMGLMAVALSLALRAGERVLGEHIGYEYDDDEARPPWSMIGAVAVGNLLASLAFGIAVAGVLHWAGDLSTDSAESLAAGAFTLGLFVLPGSGVVRRTASRILARLLPGPSATVVTVAVMGPIALTAVIVALLQGL